MIALCTGRGKRRNRVQQHSEPALHMAEISGRQTRSVACWTEMCQWEWVWCRLSAPPTSGWNSSHFHKRHSSLSWFLWRRPSFVKLQLMSSELRGSVEPERHGDISGRRGYSLWSEIMGCSSGAWCTEDRISNQSGLLSLCCWFWPALVKWFMFNVIIFVQWNLRIRNFI